MASVQTYEVEMAVCFIWNVCGVHVNQQEAGNNANLKRNSQRADYSVIPTVPLHRPDNVAIDTSYVPRKM
jgi:hypothetical protein